MGTISEKTLQGIVSDVRKADPNIGSIATMQSIIPHKEPHLIRLTNGKITLSSKAVLDYGQVSGQAWQLHVQQIVKSFIPF